MWLKKKQKAGAPHVSQDWGMFGHFWTDSYLNKFFSLTAGTTAQWLRSYLNLSQS